MTPDATRRALARRLFARALETPGGLKVQTIHAFCTQLLHQFPFEANVAARFAVLDEAEQTQLLEQLTLAVLLDGAGAPDGTLGRALADAMIAAADQTFRDVVREAIGQRDAIMRWVDEAGGVGSGDRRACRDDARHRSVRRHWPTIEAEYFCRLDRSRRPEWPASWPQTLGAGQQERRRTGRAASPHSAALSGAERVETYLEIFCTGEGAPRKSIVTKAIKDAALVERLAAEQQRVCALLERRRAPSSAAIAARALLTVTYEVLTRYQQRKGAPRAARLRRSHRQDAALLRECRCRLGALQARSRHRSRADRRGAGHQQEAVGDRRAGSPPSSPPAPVRAPSRARSSRSATRSSRSIRSRTPRRRNSPKCGAISRARYRSSGRHSFVREFEALVPLGRQRAGRGRRGVQAQGHRAQRHLRSGGFPPHIALPDAPPGVVEIWEPEKPDERQGDRRLGRAVRYRQRDQPAREAGAAHRAPYRAADRSTSSAATRAMATC